MKRTISAMRGPGSLNHNRRSFTAENVDPERSSLNVVYRDEPIQKVYHELFDEAVKRYNAKQKRKDRCINDYYEHLRTGKQEELFHELIVQIGNKDDMGVLTENGALAKELLDEYMQGFQERNPTLRVFGAFLHMDEATPHLHIDFVPYVSGWKGKGLDTKVSLKQALKALGFAGGSKRESELNQWINAEKEQLAAVMERHGIEWEQKGTHEEHLSVLDFKKQERSKEVAALEAAKQECQTDLTEMQEQLETAQTAVEAAEQRVQKAELTYQKQSQKLNKLAPIIEGLENLSAQYSQRPEEWVPEAATFETAKSYREKKAMPLIQKLVKVLFALHRKYWEVKDERDKYLHFYQDEKKATRHLSQQLEQVKAENSQLYAMKRDFRRVWNYFGAEKALPPNFCKQKRPLRVLRSSFCFLLALFQLGLLPLLLPRIQKLNDFFFHLPGRVTARKVFAQGLVFDGHSVQLTLFDFVHNVINRIVVELSLLCQLFYPLGLGKRRRILSGVHHFHEIALLLFIQIGQFHRRGKRNFLIVYKFQQLRSEIRQANIAFYGIFAHSRIFSYFFRTQLRCNLRRS